MRTSSTRIAAARAGDVHSEITRSGTAASNSLPNNDTLVREGKTLGFVELTDGSCFSPVQVVYERDDRNLGNGLSTGCAIAVSGELVMTPDAPQPFEIRASEIVLEGACPSDYPLQKKRHTLEHKDSRRESYARIPSDPQISAMAARIRTALMTEDFSFLR